MKIAIEYCELWNYKPAAASLAKVLEKKFGVAPDLIKSSGGVFEVTVDGKLIFSKKQSRRFPENQEVIDSILELK